MPFKKIILPLAAIFLIFTLVSLIIILKRASWETASPLGTPTYLRQKVTETLVPKSALAKVVEESLKDSQGTYAVAIKNLQTGQKYSLNEKKEFSSASLYKLWAMAIAFEEIKNGSLKENELLTVSQDRLNEILEVEEEGIGAAMQASQAIEQMIIISDNNAAVLLSERLGHAKITDFLQKQGLSSSSFGVPPKTTAGDIAKFYEKLYRGEIIDRQSSDKMIALLYRQRLNDRIPKYLPEDIKVAHKTGELEDFKHDAGIVSRADEDYIIVVLTETRDAQEAAEKIALLSKSVFDFFNKNPK